MSITGAGPSKKMKLLPSDDEAAPVVPERKKKSTGHLDPLKPRACKKL